MSSGLLAVFPFHQGDLDLLRQQLEWIQELGGVKDHDALLCADSATQWSDCCDLLAIASSAFRTAKLITTEQSVVGWIPGAVNLFRTVAQWAEVNQRDFWWHEPDCCALVPEWLTELEKAYRECGKLFMGPVIKAIDPRHPPFFLEGNSVYSWKSWSIMQKFIRDDEAWVTSCAPIVIPNASNTSLVHQVWGSDGTPPRFVAVRTANSAPQDFTLDHLRKGAVIFHREKTGELIWLLRRRLNPDAIDYARPPAWVQMGRIGDLILLMPAWKAWAERSGQKTVVVTSKEFGQVLEGASYIQPILTPFSWYDAAKARSWAQMRYGNVIVTQLHGTGLHTPPDDLPSFSLTMWRRTGLAEEYHTLPLVFDQRNPNREANLIAHTLTNQKPFVLVKTDAWTSPFDGSNEIRAIMREVFRDQVQIVDLDKVVAHRVYDLLGLIDKALGLVTLDTMSLHLAAGSETEYVAFTRDDGQSGSIPKRNCVLQIGYSQWEHQRYPFELQMKLWLAKAYRMSQ